MENTYLVYAGNQIRKAFYKMRFTRMLKSIFRNESYSAFLKRLKFYGTATGAQIQVTDVHSELLQAEPPGQGR